jgi:lipid A 3-O-deacylase
LQRLSHWICLLCALSPATRAGAEEEPDYRLVPEWRIEYHNDVFFKSDNKFSSGISVQRHSNLALDWSEVDAPKGTKFGRGLPGLGRAGLYRRQSMAFGQNIQTPNDLRATEPVVDDVPYAGYTGVDLSWLAFDDEMLRGYALAAGAIGPMSGAQQMQEFFHALISDIEPQGWEHQLPNELVINFNGVFKRKIGYVGGDGRWSADFAAGGGFGIGTALVSGDVGIEARWGVNMPRGFAFVPAPIGSSVTYDASLVSRDEENRYFYFSLAARAVAISHTIFLDGSLWRETARIDRQNSVNQVVFGFHLQRRSWALHATLLMASDLVISPAPDPAYEYGTIAVEWRR